VQVAVLEMIAEISGNKKSASAFESVVKKVSWIVVGIACSVENIFDAYANLLSSAKLGERSSPRANEVDFEKAFDSLRWDFLDVILDKLVFGSKWRGWIKGCLHNARSFVLINGSPTEEFELFKDEFNNHFGKYGDIRDSVIIKDRMTGQPRGFGFITYVDPLVVEKVEVKRTIPRETANSNGFKTKKIFVR
nr:heterogeneous nuclear ribonucleoprotein 1 [Tanacetum cinerariifolium]